MPALSASFTGFVNGDTSTNLIAQPTLTTTATSGSHVGSYGISAAGADDPDYVMTYVDGNLSVTPAPLTISAGNSSKIYGTATTAPTASYTGFVNGDTPSSLTAQPTLATAGTHVGSYPIVASGAVDPDYEITYGDGTLTVTPAP